MWLGGFQNSRGGGGGLNNTPPPSKKLFFNKMVVRSSLKGLKSGGYTFKKARWSEN